MLTKGQRKIGYMNNLGSFLKHSVQEDKEKTAKKTASRLQKAKRRISMIMQIGSLTGPKSPERPSGGSPKGATPLIGLEEMDFEAMDDQAGGSPKLSAEGQGDTPYHKDNCNYVGNLGKYLGNYERMKESKKTELKRYSRIAASREGSNRGSGRSLKGGRDGGGGDSHRSGSVRSGASGGVQPELEVHDPIGGIMKNLAKAMISDSEKQRGKFTELLSTNKKTVVLKNPVVQTLKIEHLEPKSATAQLGTGNSNVKTRYSRLEASALETFSLGGNKPGPKLSLTADKGPVSTLASGLGDSFSPFEISELHKDTNFYNSVRGISNKWESDGRKRASAQLNPGNLISTM